MADVEEVRERVVRADGIDEVSLKTLGDQDRRGHVALSQASQSDPVKRSPGVRQDNRVEF